MGIVSLMAQYMRLFKLLLRGFLSRSLSVNIDGQGFNTEML